MRNIVARDRSRPPRVHVFKYWFRIERSSRCIMMPWRGPWTVAEVRSKMRGLLGCHKVTKESPLEVVFFDCHHRDFKLGMEPLSEDSWLLENRMYTARLLPKYRPHLRTLHGSTVAVASLPGNQAERKLNAAMPELGGKAAAARSA